VRVVAICDPADPQDGDVALLAGRWEPRQRVDQLLLPGPVEYGAEVLAGLVARAAGVLSLTLDGLIVDPVEELAGVFAPQLSDRRVLRFEASYESSVAEAFGNLRSSPAYLSPAFLKAEPSSMNFRC
jgi:hypothetical protein